LSDIDVLRGAKLLEGLSDAQLQGLLDACPVATYQPQQVVFAEHSLGRELYVVLAGEVSVVVDPSRLGTVDQGSVDPRTIHPLGPGEAFGEVGFLTGQPRNATIVAARDATRLLVIPPETYNTALQTQTILRNIAVELSRKLHYSNTRILEDTLATYYISVLVEELATGAYDCSPTAPLQQLTVIRNPESFIICGPGRLIADLPAKEAIEVAFFADPGTLQALVAPGTPAGRVIISALFSIIRTGVIAWRPDDSPIDFRLDTADDRRRGWLSVTRELGGKPLPFTVRWQLKGAQLNPNTRTASAFLFVHIWSDERLSTSSQARRFIDNIAMPVQRSVLAALKGRGQRARPARALVIHHRSHEVARTLQTMQELGIQIDSFIGIPYGDIGWDYSTMLDEASGGTYLSLRQITHAAEPTRYAFDFRQSSFLDRNTELVLAARYKRPEVAGDYLAAMRALAEYRLVRALQICRERGERLVIYEDGGYLAASIAAIYDDPSHQSHELVCRAVDEGRIVGLLEVTVAGERKNRQIIEQRGGRALLPVLSNARSEIKAVYEALGVSEAVIQAAATALGRLGLPTFQASRVAVVGGNGAIGTRLVEQLATMHNSTANIFAVDIAPRPFALAIDAAHTPHAAHRLAFRRLPRYVVSDHCRPIVLDYPLSAPVLQPDEQAIAAALLKQITTGGDAAEVALTNSYPLEPEASAWLWRAVAERSGYALVDETALPDDGGRRYHLRRGGQRVTVVLLAAGTILTFADSARPIRAGVTTVIGCTGYPAFGALQLDAFFSRPGPPQQVDSLTLISGSSKDYEFRLAIDLLDRLLRLQSPAALAVDVRLTWFRELYAATVCFVRGEHFAPIRRLLESPLDRPAIEEALAAEPALAAAIDLDPADEEGSRERLADFLQRALRRRIAIRKDIRPDIGSLYHVTVDGRAKQVVLLADGFVINFFARHEKGVKTEFIDPVMTLQVLGLVRLLADAPPVGLYKLDAHLQPEDLATLWAAIDASCRPLEL